MRELGVVGGWTLELWVSAVSFVYSHMTRCPRGTMLNDKEPSHSVIRKDTFWKTSIGWDNLQTDIKMYTVMHI